MNRWFKSKVTWLATASVAALSALLVFAVCTGDPEEPINPGGDPDPTTCTPGQGPNYCPGENQFVGWWCTPDCRQIAAQSARCPVAPVQGRPGSCDTPPPPTCDPDGNTVCPDDPDIGKWCNADPCTQIAAGATKCGVDIVNSQGDCSNVPCTPGTNCPGDENIGKGCAVGIICDVITASAPNKFCTNGTLFDNGCPSDLGKWCVGTDGETCTQLTALNNAACPSGDVRNQQSDCPQPPPPTLVYCQFTATDCRQVTQFECNSAFGTIVPSCPDCVVGINCDTDVGRCTASNGTCTDNVQRSACPTGSTFNAGISCPAVGTGKFCCWAATSTAAAVCVGIGGPHDNITSEADCGLNHGTVQDHNTPPTPQYGWCDWGPRTGSGSTATGGCWAINTAAEDAACTNKHNEPTCGGYPDGGGPGSGTGGGTGPFCYWEANSHNNFTAYCGLVEGQPANATNCTAEHGVIVTDCSNPGGGTPPGGGTQWYCCWDVCHAAGPETVAHGGKANQAECEADYGTWQNTNVVGTRKYCNWGPCVGGSGWNCTSGGCYLFSAGMTDASCEADSGVVVTSCPAGTLPPAALE